MKVVKIINDNDDLSFKMIVEETQKLSWWKVFCKPEVTAEIYLNSCGLWYTYPSGIVIKSPKSEILDVLHKSYVLEKLENLTVKSTRRKGG